MKSPEYDVQIVGDGLAGLVAASGLEDAGLAALVLERSGELVGRTTDERVQAHILHLGTEFVGRRQLQDIALIRSFGLSPKENRANVNPARWLLPPGEVSLGSFPAMSWSEGCTSLNVCIEVSWLAFRVSVAQPWTAQRAPDSDAISLEDWLCRPGMEINLRHGILSVVEGEMSVPASQISCLFVLWFLGRSRREGLPATTQSLLIWMALRVGPFTRKALRGRLLAGIGNPLEIAMNATNCWIGEGTQEIRLRLANRLRRGTVLLNTPVVGVTQGPARPGVQVESRNGRRCLGRHSVLAIPLPQLKKRHFHRPYPAPIRDLLHDSDYGRIGTVNLVRGGGAPARPQPAFGWNRVPSAWTRGRAVVGLCPNEASELAPGTSVRATTSAFGFDLPTDIVPRTLPTPALRPATSVCKTGIAHRSWVGATSTSGPANSPVTAPISRPLMAEYTSPDPSVARGRISWRGRSRVVMKWPRGLPRYFAGRFSDRRVDAMNASQSSSEAASGAGFGRQALTAKLVAAGDATQREVPQGEGPRRPQLLTGEDLTAGALPAHRGVGARFGWS